MFYRTRRSGKSTTIVRPPLNTLESSWIILKYSLNPKLQIFLGLSFLGLKWLKRDIFCRISFWLPSVLLNYKCHCSKVRKSLGPAEKGKNQLKIACKNSFVWMKNWNEEFIDDAIKFAWNLGSLVEIFLKLNFISKFISILEIGLGHSYAQVQCTFIVLLDL